MIQFLALALKVGILKETALSGFRFIQNGFNWPATLEDIKQDHRFLAAVGKDTVNLIPALTRLQTSSSLAGVIRSAQDINRALNHLPEKTRLGLNESVGLERIIDAALAYALSRCGHALLNVRVKDESLSQGLERMYLGLFLVGRGHATLSEKHQTQVIMALLSIHEQRNTANDQRVRLILQTWLPEKALALGEALVHLKESFALYELAAPDMFKVYITAALGGNATAVNEPGLLTDLTTRFPEPTIDAE